MNFRILLSLTLLCGGLSLMALATPIPADKLFKDPEVSRVKLSPDSRLISVALNQDEVKGLALFHPKTDSLQLLGLLAKQDWIFDYKWLDNNTIYLSSGNHQAHVQSIIRLDHSADKIKSDIKLITVPGYLVGVVPARGNKVLYAQNVGSHGVQIKLMLVSVDDLLNNDMNKGQRIERLPADDANSFFSYDPSSNRLIARVLDPKAKRISFHYQELGSDRWQPLFSYLPEDYSFKPLRFLGKDKLAVISDKDSDKMALYEFDIATQQMGKLLFQHDRYDLTDAEFDNQTLQLLAVQYYQHGRLTQQHFAAVARAASQQIAKALPGQQFLVVDQSQDNKQQLIYAFSGTNPGSYYRLVAGESPQLIADKFEALNQYTLAKTELVKVNSVSGMPLEVFLTLPPGGNTGKLLVMPHGGPIGVQEFDDFDARVQYLASRGYAVLRLNFRGSAGYGKQFQHQGVAEFGKGIEADISRAVQQVNQQYKFNSMCAIGFSYGAYSAMMLAIHNPQQYRCVVAGFGVYDLPLLYNASNLKMIPEQQKRLERVLGPNKAGLRDVSPVYLAQKLMAPALIIAGMEDDIAGFEQSNRMHDILLRLGKPVEKMFYQNTGHGHDNWQYDQHEINLIDSFLQKHLGATALQSADLTESSAMQAQNIRLQADLYQEGGKIGEDLPKARQLYLQAAKLGDAESMVNLSDMLRTGAGGEVDLPQAIDWLQQAAKQNYADAFLGLGLVYSGEMDLKPDVTRAAAYFAKARALQPDGRADAYLAKHQCLGLGVPAEIPQCIAQLSQLVKSTKRHKSDFVTKRLLTAVRTVISDILIEGQLTAANRSELIQLMIYPVAEPVGMAALVDEYRTGQAASDTSTRFEEKPVYVADKELIFGSLMRVTDTDASNSVKETIILSRWTRKNAGSQYQQVLTEPRGAKRRDMLAFVQQLEETLQQPAIWTLELFNVNGQKLYTKQFQLSVPAK